MTANTPESIDIPEIVRLQRILAGKYSIEGEIGRGAMGIVLLARDVLLERPVAIKLLPGTLAEDAEWRRRLLTEARMAARLSHPNIVAIHSVEEFDGGIAIVMAYVEGESLGQRVRRIGRLPATEVVRIVQDVAWALSHAHARGVVHRDIKPDNILIERSTGRALVTDFGIARASEDRHSGGMAGTVRYMSPEQANGKATDGRADIYSLAVTAYYCLTGHHPHEADSAAGVLVKQATQPVPALVNHLPTVSRRLAALIEQSLSIDPEARPADADEFAARLAALTGSRPRSSPAVLAFVRDTYAAGGEMAVYGTAALGFFLAFEVGKGADFLGLVSMFQSVALLVALGLAGIRTGVFVTRLRELLLEGYDHAAVVRAIREIEDEDTAGRTGAVSFMRRVGIGKMAFLSVGCWSLLLAGVLPSGVEDAVAVGAALAPTALVATSRSGRTAIRKLTGKLLQSRFGRWLFRATGIGVPRPTNVIPATEHTELLLAGEVARLVEEGAADGGMEKDIVALARRLARQASELREHGENEAGVAEVVAALENLRLDLLRYRSTRANAELSEIIAQALELGAQIEARIEAEASVERIVAPPSHD